MKGLIFGSSLSGVAWVLIWRLITLSAAHTDLLLDTCWGFGWFVNSMDKIIGILLFLLLSFPSFAHHPAPTAPPAPTVPAQPAPTASAPTAPTAPIVSSPWCQTACRTVQVGIVLMVVYVGYCLVTGDEEWCVRDEEWEKTPFPK